MAKWRRSLVVFWLTIAVVLAIHLSGWRKDDWRVEWATSAVIIVALAWAAKQFAGSAPKIGGRHGPLRGLRIKVTVWDVPEPHWNIREAAAQALRALLASDGADTHAFGAGGSASSYKLEVLDVTLEHRAGSVSLTGGRDSSRYRYSMMVRLIGPDARASGTRAVLVNVPPSAPSEDIGKRLAYEVGRRLGVMRSVDGAARLLWRDRAQKAG